MTRTAPRGAYLDPESPATLGSVKGSKQLGAKLAPILSQIRESEDILVVTSAPLDRTARAARPGHSSPPCAAGDTRSRGEGGPLPLACVGRTAEDPKSAGAMQRPAQSGHVSLRLLGDGPWWGERVESKPEISRRAKGFLAWLQGRPEAYNIGADEEHSVLDVVRTILSVVRPGPALEDWVRHVPDRRYQDQLGHAAARP
jgi:hypothetical protein